MGISGALQIGRSGLLANQSALEVAGNNLANIATPGYHRQTLVLQPTRSQEVQQGQFIGTGVQVQQIVRQIDLALEGRIRAAISDQSQSQASQEILTQLEAIQNELSDIDLSSHLGAFFNAFSDLANRPDDNAVRAVVLQEGQSLATFIRGLRSDLVQLRSQVDQSIESTTQVVDDLLTQIQQVNTEIAKTEQGAGGAHGLRDQRDLLLGELAQLLDISIIEQSTGATDVFVGSLPIILNGLSRGVEIRQQTINGQVQDKLVISADGSTLEPTSGRLGQLLAGREQDLTNAIDTLDQFANQLIFQVNQIHSQGQALEGFSSVLSSADRLDPTLPLNDPATGLDFVPTHGSFQIHLTQQSTGQRTTSLIDIDLDGINPATDTSLNSLAAAISSVANVSATVTTDGRLQIDALGSDLQVSFSDDTSGVLAALGINTFFTGGDAVNIQVNDLIQQNTNLIAAAFGHVPGDNRTALAIAGLRDQSITDLNNVSLADFWNRHVQDVGAKLGSVNQKFEADAIVLESLEAKQQSISGVNADEEAINLLTFQRAFQGSARFLTVVDELFQTLLGLI